MLYTSKNKVFTGTVELFDHFIMPQVVMVEEALYYKPESIELTVTDKDGKEKTDKFVTFTEQDKFRIPAIVACVKKWDLSEFPENVTAETFPLTPRKAAHELVSELWEVVRDIYNGERTVPNE